MGGEIVVGDATPIPAVTPTPADASSGDDTADTPAE
jgi:hypothetical protein